MMIVMVVPSHQQTSCAFSKWTSLNVTSNFATFLQGFFSLHFTSIFVLFFLFCFVFIIPYTHLVLLASLFSVLFFKVVHGEYFRTCILWFCLSPWVLIVSKLPWRLVQQRSQSGTLIDGMVSPISFQRYVR